MDKAFSVTEFAVEDIDFCANICYDLNKAIVPFHNVNPIAMTKKITQTGPMTDAQAKQIKRFLEDGLSAIDFTTFGFSKEEAQEIIEKGDIVQKQTKEMIIASLRKHAIIDARFGAPVAQFDLTVPMDYNHDTQIDTFSSAVKKLKTTSHYNDALTSKNFAKATNKLVPGKAYTVKIFPIFSKVLGEDCMNFLTKQRAVLVGAQGLMLAQSLHPEQFPEDKNTVSFDQKEALWEDPLGFLRMPDVYHYSGGGWDFRLNLFENVLDSDSCLVCFCYK